MRKLCLCKQPGFRGCHFKGTDAHGEENALTVPEGGFITFSQKEGDWRFMGPNNEEFNYSQIYENQTALPTGYKFYFNGDASGAANSHVIVYAHEYSSSGSTFSLY